MKSLCFSRLLTGVACLACSVQNSHGEGVGSVLFGPTPTQIVVHVETEFKISDAPNFDQIYSFQTGEPTFWEADFVALQSPYFGDGSPGLVIEFFSGALEQGLQLDLSNSYLRSHRRIRLDSDLMSPAEGAGVAWSFWFSDEVPMYARGNVTYDVGADRVRVSVTFFAGVAKPAEQINQLISLVENAPGMNSRLQRRMMARLERAQAAINAGRCRLARLYLAGVTEPALTRLKARHRIPEDTADQLGVAAGLILLSLP
jgi:hypothetical protein